MKIIRPIRTICDNIISSNVVQDVPLYNVATTYSKGARVVDSACGDNVYESLVNSNTGNALTDVTKWLPVGSSNYFALFDEKTGTQTTRADFITYEVSFNSLVNSVAILNVEANTARFEVWDDDDNKLADATISLREYGVPDFYEYFFEEITFKDRYVKFDIPAVTSGRGKLTLERTGGIAKIGAMIYGSQFSIGDTQWGSSFGIRDYSTKENDAFGNTIIVERAFSDKIEADVFVDLKKVGQIRKVLTQFRAQPVVWSGGDAEDALLTYGYYKDFSVILSTPAGADCAIQIEGLI